VPIAIGTDAGGSIRRPAGYTGILGLRPSTGRIPRRFGFPALSHDFQVIAPAARTVDELYSLFRTIAIPDLHDRASLAFGAHPFPETIDSQALPRLRIRYVTGIGDEPIDQDIRIGVARAAAQLAALGHEVVEGPVPYDLEEVERIRSTLSSVGVARALCKHQNWREQVGTAIATIADTGMPITAVNYVKALDSLQDLRANMTREFETFDVLLTATSAAMPWPVELPYPPNIDGRKVGPRGASLFASFVNASGFPALSVPVEPSSRGLPIGMQLVGRFGADILLLRLAKQFEISHPWANRWPQIAG